MSNNKSSTPRSPDSTGTGSWFSGLFSGRVDTPKTPKIPNDPVELAGNYVGPVNKKKQFQGVLFKYGPKPIQVSSSCLFHVNSIFLLNCFVLICFDLISFVDDTCVYV